MYMLIGRDMLAGHTVTYPKTPTLWRETDWTGVVIDLVHEARLDCRPLLSAPPRCVLDADHWLLFAHH